jgi:glycosyltransferase involved in cell wall biosynthesis
MVTGRPSVTALMPAWNSAAFIEATLTALRAQTYPNLRILVCDDASSDDTAALCARFAAEDARFTLLRNSRRLGWIGNTNRLLHEVHTEYCMFAFHDDPLHPECIARLVEALEHRPAAVLAFSDVDVGPHRKQYTELDGVVDRVERGRRMIRKDGLWWIPNRGLFRADAARRIGGVRRHLAGEYSADWPWLLHLALLGEFERVPQPLVRKVFRTDGVSHRWKGTPWQAFAVAASCARTIARSGLERREQLMLYRELGGRAARGLYARLRG